MFPVKSLFYLLPTLDNISGSSALFNRLSTTIYNIKNSTFVYYFFERPLFYCIWLAFSSFIAFEDTGVPEPSLL